jgi:hypothetical protein
MTEPYKKNILDYARSLHSNRTEGRKRRAAAGPGQQGFQYGWLQIGPDAANWQAQGTTHQNAGRVKTILQVRQVYLCVCKRVCGVWSNLSACAAAAHWLVEHCEQKGEDHPAGEPCAFVLWVCARPFTSTCV